MKKVQGQRSPRWAFWQRFMIPCRDGTVYLARLRLIQTPWFGIYLHDIYEDDGDRDPHNHPWSFISIVLRGWYQERLYLDPLTRRDEYEVRTYKRFSAHRMDRDSAHRIVEAAPRLKTLILTGPRRASWGFFKQDYPYDKSIGSLVDWSDYEREFGSL